MSIQRAALDADIRAATAEVKAGDLVNALMHLQTAMQRAWRLHDRVTVTRIADSLIHVRSLVQW